MTDRVNPSASRSTDPRQTATAIRYGSTYDSEGYIVPSGTTLIADTEGLTGTPFEGFRHRGAGARNNLTAQFTPGEAMIGGAWIARDEESYVDLPASTTTEVHVGWTPGSPDNIRVAAAGDWLPRDSHIPIYRITTDATQQIDSVDLREYGPLIDVPNLRYDANGDGVVDEASYATSANHAATADSATSATTATNSAYLDGYSPTLLARNQISLSLPVARIKPGDVYQIPFHVPTNTTAKLLRLSRQTNTFGSYTNLPFRVRTSSGTISVDSASKSVAGTLASPIQSWTGGQDLLFGLENTSSSVERKAGGYAVVFLDA